ncbi:MAG: NAD-dependent epimerase/dehydratase family protein, partial [Acidimicrobiia bacterium]|nr:NAD-dependent epimerase/dehydratase family protein [Acidimicrobiia bacterium]
MKALVTGAGGFVGPHLVRHLIDAGDAVTALDLSNGPDLRDREGWQAAVAEH